MGPLICYAIMYDFELRIHISSTRPTDVHLCTVTPNLYSAEDRIHGLAHARQTLDQLRDSPSAEICFNTAAFCLFVFYVVVEWQSTLHLL